MFSVLKLVNADDRYKNCTAVYPRPFTVKPVLWIEGAKRQQVMLGEAFAEVTVPVAQHWLFDPSLHRRVNIMGGVDNFFEECFPDGSKIGLAMEGNMLTIKAELPRRKMSEEEFNDVTGQFYCEAIHHDFRRALTLDQLVATSQSIDVEIPDGINSDGEIEAAITRELAARVFRVVAASVDFT